MALPLANAWAAESLIYENDSTRPFNARTLIIDNLDKGGNLTLKFGKTLNEQFFWDNTASKFKLTDDLDVQGTASGAAVHAAGGNVTISTNGTAIFNVNENAVNFRIATDNQTNMFFVDGTNDRIGIKTSSPETELEIVGTASGRTIHAQDRLTASGTLSIDSGFFQDGMTDCDTAGTSKLLWDESTGTFSCGTDTDTNTNQLTTFTLTGDSGSDQTVQHGDTLDIEGGTSITTTVGTTDKVTVDITDNTVNFTELSDALSLDADTTLTFGTSTFTFNLDDSGDFNIQDNGTSVFFVRDDGKIGIGTTSPDTKLEIVGTASGSTIHAQDRLTSSGTLSIDSGFFQDGMTDCDSSSSKLIWDETTGTFSCGTDGGGDLSQASADDRYVRQSGDTMTGTLTISNEGSEPSLNVRGTASGRTLHAQDSLTSSGTLSIEGTASFGSTLRFGGIDYTFPGADGASSGRVLSTDGSGNLSWALIGTGALQTRERQIHIPIDTAAITTDGTDNEANVFIGSQTGSTVNPHHYYRVETGSGQIQDVDIRIKVLLPKDFVDFSNSDDLSFTYRTRSATDTVNKLDILVEDDDGDDAFTAADGQGLANTSWTAYTDEFDGGSFNPAKGEYIHIHIKGYTTSSGMAYAGEIILTYTAR